MRTSHRTPVQRTHAHEAERPLCYALAVEVRRPAAFVRFELAAQAIEARWAEALVAVDAVVAVAVLVAR
jgi:hypothetical protein